MTNADGATPFMVDLHIHTTAGSADSSLRPAALRQRAVDLGIDALHIAEHFRVWTDYEAAEFVRGVDLALFRGMEWNTRLGHVLVVGSVPYRSDLESVVALRRYVQETGGLMIAAHPYRHAFDAVPAIWKAHKSEDRSVEAACAHPLLEFVDAIEVLNGACTDRENELAALVAAHLRMPGIGGSDAHYLEDVGRAVSLFDAPMCSEAQLVAAIRAGKVRAAPGPAMLQRHVGG